MTYIILSAIGIFLFWWFAVHQPEVQMRRQQQRFDVYQARIKKAETEIRELHERIQTLESMIRDLELKLEKEEER